VTTAYGSAPAPYGTTGHHPMIRFTVRLNPFIQPLHNHRPLLLRCSTCDMHEWFWATPRFEPFLRTFTSTPHSSRETPHGWHLEQRPGQLLKGDTPWMASGATPRTRIEIPTAFFFFFHVTMIDMVFTDLRMWTRLLPLPEPHSSHLGNERASTSGASALTRKKA